MSKFTEKLIDPILDETVRTLALRLVDELVKFALSMFVGGLVSGAFAAWLVMGVFG